MGDGSGNIALLRFLVRAKLLTNELAQAAEAQLGGLQNGKSLIDWLKDKGGISEEELAKSLAKHSRLPFVDLPTVALDSAVTSLVREELAMQYHVVPLRVTEQALTVAMANPLDRGAIRAIEFATSKTVHAEVATQTAIRDALEHAYHLDEALDQYLKNIPEDGEVPIAEAISQEATDIRGLMRDTNLAPVVKLFNSILREALRTGASDIHIEATSSGLRVRNRVDGLLEDSIRLPKWVQDPLIARCKVLAKLDITERRVPQDGRIQIRYGDSMVDLRVSSLPTQFGEKITMRVLDPGTAPSSLDGFSFSDRELTWIRHASKRPEGIILVTGPTGSGKSTTLYGMIAEIVSPVRNIITIENPIEYQMDGVNQVEINDKQGLTFASTLRSILRQDPDVILVGEIRDAETAEVALRAAQTGHLVLSSLHTNDAVCTITRLLDLGIEPYMLSSALHLVIAQRLVRRVCKHCAEPYEPDRATLRRLEIDPDGKQFLRGRGCKQCRKSGYAGRVAIFEVLPITSSMARLIEKRSPESALRLQARADGTTFLSMNAALRVCAGATTADEALRVVDIGLQAVRCPSCDRSVEDTFAVCPHCATVLRRNCTSCGAQLEDDWQICPHCAVPATRLAPPAAHLQPAAAATHPPAPLSVGPRQYRALVVDDHADMRRLIAFSLEHSNLAISVVTAASGTEAIERAQEDPPDLVLLDVMMPGMDGFAVCEQLRGDVRTAFIPILMLTARDDAASRARGFLAGTDDYLGKPFARAELLARVRRLIERTYGALLPTPPTSGIAAVADLSPDIRRVSLQ
ncbi:MAG: ATPase, T2SS/T4P/T4SS family [Candidatus Binatia bacterium]